MPHKLKRWVFNHFRDNFFIYFVVTALFFIGIVIGSIAIKVLQPEKVNRIMLFVNSLFKSIDTSDINNISILKQSLIDNYKAIFVIWVTSTLFVGIIIVPIIVLFKGFALGFSVGFFVYEYGLKGFLFSILGIFSQNLFIVPGIISISAIGLAFSMKNIKKRKNRSRNNKFLSEFIDYSLLILLFSAFLLIGCFIEAYLTPIFMKFFLNYLN